MDKAVSILLDKFREARHQRKLSHEKIAVAVGLHRSTISLLESKKRTPTIKTCLKISKALGISLHELLKDIEKKTNR